METPVKERLVGAAVLMAAAVLLVPEMLSGPDRSATAPTERGGGDTPLKTYTIDLNQPPGGQKIIDEDEVRAPPAEDVVELSALDTPEPATGGQVKAQRGEPVQIAPTQRSPESKSAASVDPPKKPAVTAPVVEAPTPTIRATTPAPRSLASASAGPTSGGWAVQLGSFSRKDTAERLAGELRAEGRNAFVMPVRSGGATLYRVRVGPVKDRASAEASLRVLKAKAPGAAVVAHP